MPRKSQELVPFLVPETMNSGDSGVLVLNDGASGVGIRHCIGHLTVRFLRRGRRLLVVGILSWLVCCANETTGVCITSMWANEIHSSAYYLGMSMH